MGLMRCGPIVPAGCRRHQSPVTNETKNNESLAVAGLVCDTGGEMDPCAGWHQSRLRSGFARHLVSFDAWKSELRPKVVANLRQFRRQKHEPSIRIGLSNFEKAKEMLLVWQRKQKLATNKV